MFDTNKDFSGVRIVTNQGSQRPFFRVTWIKGVAIQIGSHTIQIGNVDPDKRRESCQGEVLVDGKKMTADRIKRDNFKIERQMKPEQYIITNEKYIITILQNRTPQEIIRGIKAFSIPIAHWDIKFKPNRSNDEAQPSLMEIV